MNVLQFALEMEQDGEAYYYKQAQAFADTPLKPVFETLARQEHKHADLLRSKMEGTPYTLTASEEVTNRKNLFRGMKDYTPPVKANPAQAPVYREARELEQKSIDLYSDLREKTDDADTKALLDFLVKEETRHYEILEELFRFVNRPNEWVEDAEFGLREEY